MDALSVVFAAVVFGGLCFGLWKKLRPKQKPADPRIDPKAASVPLPGPGEDANQYMLRCIRDPIMVSQYPDRNTRINQCSALWTKTKLK